MQFAVLSMVLKSDSSSAPSPLLSLLPSHMLSNQYVKRLQTAWSELDKQIREKLFLVARPTVTMVYKRLCFSMNAEI